MLLIGDWNILNALSKSCQSEFSIQTIDANINSDKLLEKIDFLPNSSSKCVYYF